MDGWSDGYSRSLSDAYDFDRQRIAQSGYHWVPLELLVLLARMYVVPFGETSSAWFCDSLRSHTSRDASSLHKRLQSWVVQGAIMASHGCCSTLDNIKLLSTRQSLYLAAFWLASDKQELVAPKISTRLIFNADGSAHCLCSPSWDSCKNAKRWRWILWSWSNDRWPFMQHIW